jgi:hypothetical protein
VRIRDLLLLAALAPALVAGCATKRPPLPPAPKPTARLELGAAVSLDQYRASLPGRLLIEAPAGSALRLESAAFELSVEGGNPEVLRYGPLAPAAAAAGDGQALAFELPVDLRSLGPELYGPGGPSTAAFALRSRATATSSDGQRVELLASAAGELPIIREPSFRITSIKIGRDLLVTTSLTLGLEIANPNAFPIELRSLSYDFYGEGQVWADGRLEGQSATGAGAAGAGAEGSAIVAALSTAERELSFTMNFASADRRLFDLVAKLGTVRYRLAGEARIGTAIAALGDFTTRFDREGSCPVDR